MASQLKCDGLPYRFPAVLPKERVGLQIRTYAVFLANARGSLAELETQLVIARELKFLERDDSAQLLVPIWGAY